MKITRRVSINKISYCAGMLLVVLGLCVVTKNTSAVPYTLSVTSSGAQSIDVSSMGDGTSISSDTINVTTTCRSGYNFTINTSVDDNNLYLNGDSTNNTAGTYFSPASGSTALKDSTNTWGYYSGDTAPTSSSNFNPVPALGNTATIKTPLATPSSTDVNDNFNIYYGVTVSNDMPIGTYKMIPDTNNSNKNGTIVYQATIAEACTQYTVHYDPTGTFNGQNITGTGTVADQAIHEGIATALTSSTFTGPTVSGTTYYFAGWNTARDGSGTSYRPGQSVTDLTTVGNTITLYAQWTDCSGNNICYSSNATSGVEGTMGNQTISNSDTSATLLASNFSREGYGFAGWNTKADGTGTNYGPNEDITFTAGQYSLGGLRLYANWIASAGKIQDWTGCSSMNIGDVTALTDERDNNTYAIAKLADNKCWMIENLRLENTNSDNATGSLAQGYNASFVGLADPESANFNSNGVANSLYSTDGSTSAPQISGSNTGYRFPRYNNVNTTSRTENPTANNSNIYGYGNYYTWHAAIADTTYYNTNNATISGTSLCPHGWHLPSAGQTTVNTTADFYTLGKAIMNNVEPDQDASGGYGYYGNSVTNTAGDTAPKAFRKYPNNFVYSGYFNTSSAYNRGSNGRYWSSTAYDNLNSYYLYLNSAYVYPGTAYSRKSNGHSIRCLMGS